MKIHVDSRTSFARRPHNDALSFQGSKVIHRSGLTMESEVSLNFTTGRWKARFALLSTDEIEDFLLACSELGHRCSTEHLYQLSKSRKLNRDFTNLNSEFETAAESAVYSYLRFL